VRVSWAAGRGHWLLARRYISGPTEIAYYVCYGPRSIRLIDLAKVAGSRWRIEECFQQAKNEAGLDHYQVRTWRAWYAHITLAMAAHAWLSRGQNPCHKRGTGTGHEMMIGYTVPEIRRLLLSLAFTSLHPPDRVWAWSRWRRRRQHQARISHYRRRGYP
jgi:hypothetical protein